MSDSANRLLLAFGPGDWPRDASRLSGSPRYHLWGLASRGWHVLYVEPPRRLRLQSELRDYPVAAGGTGQLQVLSPALVPPFAVRYAPPGRVGEWWREWTASSLANCADANLTAQPRVIWFGAPWHAPLARRYAGRATLVHHVYDELSKSPIYTRGQAQRLAAWEKELAENVEICFCSSQQQVERRQRFMGNAVFLPNAVQDDFAQVRSTPAGQALGERMQSMRGPRLVYGGVADQRLDPDCFLSLLKDGFAGSLVFLGTKSERLDPRLAALEKDPRVLFAGEIAYRDYPELYRHADVLLLGHRRSPFTDAMYPEKLNEYLASGRPVVAIDLPEVQRIAEAMPKGCIRIASNAADFGRLATLALEGDTVGLRDARIRWAASRTWSRAAESLDVILREALRDHATV